jgi:type IV secretory pathway VirB2 component (pilin)
MVLPRAGRGARGDLAVVVVVVAGAILAFGEAAVATCVISNGYGDRSNDNGVRE